MTEIEQFRQDSTIKQLLEIVASVRNGDYVGVTVVVTDKDGRVEMKTLSIPVPGSVPEAESPQSFSRLAQAR